MNKNRVIYAATELFLALNDKITREEAKELAKASWDEFNKGKT